MSTTRIDPRLMKEGRRTRGALRASIGLGLVSGWLIIAQAVLLAQVINRISFHHANLAAVAPFLWGLAGLFLLRGALTYAAEITAFKAAAQIKTGLRAELLARLLQRGPVGAADEASADVAATLIEGIEALEPYFSRYMPQMALCVAVPLAILVLVFPLDLYSGLILLVAGPLVPVFMVFVGYRAEAINQRQWEKLLLMSTHFLDMLQGLTTLKLFGRARDEIDIVARITDDYRRTTMAGLRVAFLTSAVLEFFASVAIALVAVLFGARLIHARIDFYPAFLVLLLAPEYFVPLRGLSVHYHARMTAIAAAKRIFALLDAPVPEAGTSTVPQGALEISCENLRFSYDDTPVLDGLTANFPAGKITAIVGESGAGKTTLARALLGFIRPQAGRIAVNGEDLSRIAQEEWWKALAWVPQNPRLFTGSIADNLRLGAPEADDAALRDAAARAKALDFIETLPGKFGTDVGEAGGKLSGGQIQRLALARAYLKNPRLLILDEATANLDMESEKLVLDAIEEVAQGRTVIVIAHRLAMAARADQVLVLKGGRIAQAGPPQTLAAQEGPYRELLRAYEGEEAVPCAI
ncbi:MAG: thiol reductant ABC exporter subunit CydD [Acidocella sp.]|nr:thiol reductant ABC exporter subunit CydD [Acidocella sp.]MDR3717642.1 thiol reductant ABC exporter subunit CydD [Bryobacteraceae bacterium]